MNLETLCRSIILLLAALINLSISRFHFNLSSIIVPRSFLLLTVSMTSSLILILVANCFFLLLTEIKDYIIAFLSIQFHLLIVRPFVNLCHVLLTSQMNIINDLIVGRNIAGHMLLNVVTCHTNCR